MAVLCDMYNTVNIERILFEWDPCSRTPTNNESQLHVGYGNLQDPLLFHYLLGIT